MTSATSRFEVVAGLQHDVGLDLVLGAAYVHRDLGRVVEDISAGGLWMIANPGEPVDAGVLQGLQDRITAISARLVTAQGAERAQLEQERGELATSIQLYRAASEYQKPRRDYDALVLTASKRFSHDFVLLASYTYGRSMGNYTGLYNAVNGQIAPNLSSQFDLNALQINRDGPLPNDRPHDFKLAGAWRRSLGALGDLLLGLNFRLLSGAPIEVLGRDSVAGSGETFILPRGSGGRLPLLTSLDARLGWSRALGAGLRAEITLDVFNVLNQQEVTAVDMIWTSGRVLPLEGGTPADLKSLKSVDGSLPVLNPNYGHAVAYQQPLSLRFGCRITF